MDTLVIWAAAFLIVTGIVVPYAMRFRRRVRADQARRAEALSLGLDRASVQHPIIDELRCIGCGSCMEACPEGDVLGIVAGRAVIVNGLRCVGHGLCEPACPVGALEVGLGDLAARGDIPMVNVHGETSVPGLYVAGELSGFALIRNAVEQGRRSMERIATTMEPGGVRAMTDVLVVGAGPAGIAAALTARERGLSCLLVDQQEPGGTILQYPRRKLVLTQPVEMPLHGRLDLPEYTKEELLEIWQGILGRFRIATRIPERVEAVVPRNGHFEVRGASETFHARRVVLALGRRGTPRRLGVPGEERAKVAYQLKDAASYTGRDLLVVGGGDSAVEAAVALSLQAGNRVTLSYRRQALVRIRRRNQERIAPLLERGAVRGLFGSNVVEIGEDHVRLRRGEADEVLPNDYVFIFAGGEPPFGLLREAGVAFADGAGT